MTRVPLPVRLSLFLVAVPFAVACDGPATVLGPTAGVPSLLMNGEHCDDPPNPYCDPWIPDAGERQRIQEGIDQIADNAQYEPECARFAQELQTRLNSNQLRVFQGYGATAPGDFHRDDPEHPEWHDQIHVESGLEGATFILAHEGAHAAGYTNEFVTGLWAEACA